MARTVVQVSSHAEAIAARDADENAHVLLTDDQGSRFIILPGQAPRRIGKVVTPRYSNR
jgi:hypothetical protein